MNNHTQFEKKNYSIRIDSWLLDDARLNNTDRILYGLIYTFSLNNKGMCMLKYGQIAEYLHIQKRSLYYSLKKLETFSYIEKIQNKQRVYLKPRNNEHDINTMQQRQRKKYDRGFEYDVFDEED